MSDIRNLVDRLTAREERFVRSEFLAPVVSGARVFACIDGVVCQLRVVPAEFTGWGVFRAQSFQSASLVREATLRERQRYLESLPAASLILTRSRGGVWYGIAADGGARLRVDGEVPIRLIDTAEIFAIVRTRFDGENFWFEAPDSRRSPATAAWLREALERMVPPDQLHRSGLTPQERTAYALNFVARRAAQERVEEPTVESRLRSALGHAGGQFAGFAEHRDGYRVTYVVDGRRHISSVRKDDLSLQVAGICLDGEDAKFDLKSLVGVLQEGGEDMLTIGGEDGDFDEDAYWQIHPAV